MATPRHRAGGNPFPTSALSHLPRPLSRSRSSGESGWAHPGWLGTIGRTSYESALVLVAVLVYFLVRGLMASSLEQALGHAHDLLALERALGVAWEADLQRWANGIPGLMGVMNSVYIYGHWPVIALTLAWLLWKHPARFRTYRMAMVLSGLIGFLFFALYPTAPPRLLPELGFVDTVLRDTSAYRVLQPPAFTNQYAAMPSLHVGWNLLMGMAIWASTRRAGWRAFAVTMPLAMWAATVLTANHFVLDGVFGAAVALAGLQLAILIRSRTRVGEATSETEIAAQAVHSGDRPIGPSPPGP